MRHYQRLLKCGRPVSPDINEVLQGDHRLLQVEVGLVLHHLRDHKGDSYRNDSVSKKTKEYLQPIAVEPHS